MKWLSSLATPPAQAAVIPAPPGGAPPGGGPPGDSPPGDSPPGDSPPGDSPPGDSPHEDAPHEDAPHEYAPHEDAPLDTEIGDIEPAEQQVPKLIINHSSSDTFDLLLLMFVYLYQTVVVKNHHRQ